MTRMPSDTAPATRWRDAALFSLGFRPFFLGAAGLAVVAIALWALSLRGIALMAPEMGVRSWHMHEMIYGYGGAVLTGFLFTAVPNWTGRKPVAGLALMALFALWLAGRVVMLTPLPAALIGLVDSLYLPVIAAIIAREIISSRNWRNLVVLVPVSIFALGNILFHTEAALTGDPAYAMRLGLGALVLLISIVGGRIVPAFSRNWLMQQGATRLPVPMGRYDALCLVAGGLALALWVIWPLGWPTALALGLAGVLHLVRLTRWAGLTTLPNPLLFVLHVAYAMVPLGMLALGFVAGFGDLAGEVAAIHILGIGAIGGMTLSVMIRASLGHTGRALRATPGMNAALVLVFAAMLARIGAAATPVEAALIDLAALLWIAAFVLFLTQIGPSLLRPRPGGRGA